MVNDQLYVVIHKQTVKISILSTLTCHHDKKKYYLKQLIVHCKIPDYGFNPLIPDNQIHF